MGVEALPGDSSAEGPIIELSKDLKLSVSERLIKRGLAVLGMRGSGKSYTCGVIAEELARVGQPFVVIDLMGEYYTLRERFPVLIVGLESTGYTDLSGLKPEHAEPLIRFVVENGVSLVLDLSQGTMAERVEFLADFLEAFYRVEEELRRPYVLIVDEAHRIAPEKGLPRLERISKSLKRAYYWLYEIAATGRHIGMGLVIAVRRPAEISKSILAQAEVKIVHKLVDPTDLRKLHEEGLPSELDDEVRSLEPGEAVVLGLGEPFITKVKERSCTHGGEAPLIKPVASPDLEKTIRALAKILGLKSEEERLPVPSPKAEGPRAPEEQPRPARELVLPEFDVQSFDYPPDVVANYLVRMMVYGHLGLFVPRSDQQLAFETCLVPDAPSALKALARRLSEEGWSIREIGEEGERILLASLKEVVVGMAVAEAEGQGVLALVLSSPLPTSLDKALSRLRILMADTCPSTGKAQR